MSRTSSKSVSTHALTPGVFDLLHVGHVRYIRNAATCADYLTVAVQDDRDVEQQKGMAPIVRLADRMELVAALDGVHDVVSYRGSDLCSMLEGLYVDVLHVANDYGEADAGQRATLQWCRDNHVVLAQHERTANVSSSQIRDDMQQFWDDRARLVFGPRATMLGSCGGTVDRQLEETDKELELLKSIIGEHGVTGVLDLGCGKGRLGLPLMEIVRCYMGVDSSLEMIEHFRENAPRDDGESLIIHGSVVDALYGGFTLCVMSGLLTCLNDADAAQVIAKAALSDRIFVRSSVGCHRRIDVIRQWSPDLNALYTAYYRTEDEIDYLMAQQNMRKQDRWDLYQDHPDTKMVAMLYEKT